ncbi:MAG: DUF1273 domain-containing protein [Firmicutes bacterium]|nr:DUF1273 domain-containing protein [Bacillota bacterium]
MSLTPKTCFFTGHRFIGFDETAEIKSRLHEELLNAVNAGYTRFITGGAVGFDTLAAEQVISLREDYDIRLVLYLPCINHSRNWRENDKIRFERIFSLADEVFYVTKEPYRSGCMKKRNSAMVEVSDLCIAFLKNMRSGTAQTVKMADDKGIYIVNIADIIDL